MKIGIDARFLTHPQAGGFKTYTRNLIAALARVDGENDYVLYVDREQARDSGPECSLPDGRNFRVCVVPGTLPMAGMPWREQVGLPLCAAADRIDLLHSPALTAPVRLACPLVVTIHDTIWMNSANAQSGKRQLMAWYYRRVPEIVARRARAILTVSHAAKRSIERDLGVNPERVFVTYNAANPIFRRLDDTGRVRDVARARGVEQPFILAIGSADPRKNLGTLVRAYAALPQELRSRYLLAIVWTHPLLSAELAELAALLGVGDRLRFLQGVSDEDLVALYNAAALFVFPSRWEGFGLPLVEAMACGAPVVGSDNSSIPEIAGDAAVLVGSEDVAAMADAMARVLTDAGLRSQLVQAGRKRAAEFSWEASARETVKVYRQALISSGFATGGDYAGHFGSRRI